MPKQETRAIDNRDHQIKSTINISGTEIVIGTYNGDGVKSCLFFQIMKEQAEPTYFTISEADLFIASLKACIEDLNGDH